MSRFIRFLGLSIFFGIFSFSIVQACEDCSNEISLEETIERSDLIVIGHRIDNFNEKEPQYIDVRVTELLKGEITVNPITVQSYTATCAYGLIILDDADYLIFLRKEGDQYDAVNGNCGVTKLAYVDGMVNLGGQYNEELKVEEFVELIGEDGKHEFVEYSKSYKMAWIFFAIPIFIILFLFRLYIRR